MNIVKSGNCRTATQRQMEDVEMRYALDDTGVLYIYGNHFVLAEPAQSDCEDSEFDEPQLVSQFAGLDFHRAVIMPGVAGLGESCFSGCKNLSEVVVDRSGLYLHTKFVDDAQDVEVNDDNLCPLLIEHQMWHSPD